MNVPYAGQSAMIGNGAMASESSSPIRDRICSAEQWLSDLHMAVDNLEKRLDTVLSPVPPQVPATTNQTAPVGPPKSHVQGRLEILNEGFNHLCMRLNHLHSRIEL